MAISRRKILINRPFQLRFSLYVCLYLIALSFIYPFVIYNLFEFFFRYLSLDPTGPDIATLYGTRRDILWLMAFVQLAFLAITFLNSVFISHRIAGPLYKLRKFMAEAKAGNLDQKLAFRKSDYFKDLATDYNEMMDAIRARIANGGGSGASSATAGNEAPAIAAATTAIVHLERALPQASAETRAELEGALAALRSVATRG